MLKKTFKQINDVSHFFNKPSEKHEVVSPTLQGISRTAPQAVPDAYFNGPAYALKTEIWVRLGGLYHADYVVVLNWFGIDAKRLLS